MISGYDNIMKHTGTHIEMLCGKKSKFGRDEKLWQSLLNNLAENKANGEKPPCDGNGEGNCEGSQSKAFDNLRLGGQKAYIDINGELTPYSVMGGETAIENLKENRGDTHANLQRMNSESVSVQSSSKV